MAKSKLTFDNPLISGRTEEPTDKKGGRARREDLIRTNSSQEGLPPEYTRFSAICKVQNVKNLRDYAYTKRITVKEALDEAIEAFFDAYNQNPKNEKLLDHTKGKR